MRYLIEFYLNYRDLGDRSQEFLQAELARTAELAAKGMVIGEWRRADARGAVAVWDCASHDVLNETPRGLPIWRSHDLIHWDRLGTVFPRSQPFPSWGPTEVPGTRGVWAPDISFFAGKYHLYYAVSTFGKNHSAIGLATNVTLDPAAPGYHWVDDGPVFESKATDDFNAIDPNLVMDDKGVPWLVFGSFWGGIKARRLEAATGKLDPADTTLYSLAARPDTKTKAIEGAFVIKHDSYWYLFVSFDFCCRGVNSNYRVMVGRSRELLGPYIDKNGTAMMAGGGTQILAGDGKRIRGPGHCAVVHDGDKWWMSNHFYDADDNGASKLQIHPLTWDDAGWPVVGAPLAPAK